jgi:phosphoribosylformylglycinamidine synthase
MRIQITVPPVALAMAVDGNGRYCYLDPHRGAMLAVAEAARNVACAGARPIGATNCLNFGNPEKPEVMGQLVRAIEGIGEACRALGAPITGGNVSLYNETDGRAIQPTPTIGMVGLVDDVSRTVTSWFKDVGDLIVLVGETREELGASEYLALIHGREEGAPPGLDLALEAAVQEVTLLAIEAGISRSAHDCSEGGLAVALAEMCFARGLGVKVSLKPARKLRADALIFGEDASRIVVAFAPRDRERVEGICRAAGAEFTDIGEVGGALFQIEGVVQAPVSELREAWAGAIPRLVGEGIHQAALEGVP